MWKLFVLFAVLSVDAQRSKFNQIVRDKVAIPSVEASQDNDLTYRLPNDTRPVSYVMNLNFEDFQHGGDAFFTGNVAISIRVIENTSTITLHSSVDITDVWLRNSVNVLVPHERKLDPVREFLVITTSEVFERGATLLLTVSYQGTIGNAISGVYRGSYQHDSERRFFVATHMQPTFFRRVSPGYDEPQFKARFTIVLRYNSMFKSISNMPQDFSFADDQGRTITGFEETPLMPTYLVAFVISDFEMNSMTNVNNVLFRAFARPDQIGNTKFGLETGAKALEVFESTFGTRYALGKLDQVAMPVFNRGGMENYGIVFYREDYFLYDERTTAIEKEFAAATIVHEVCHKFLGNLLTPHFWSVLWLSEGFCRFYEYYMTEKLFPSMRMEELFAVEAAQTVLYRDSRLDTRPMTRYEESPKAVAALFDDIAYTASVIRMFFYTLSEPTFHKGLQIYLSKSTSTEDGVAKPSHLYEALQQAADADETFLGNKSIAELFGSWETQAGYPIVRVERSYNNRMIRFTQNRFTDSIADNAVRDELWHIPITYASKVDPTIQTTPKFWLSERMIEICFDEVDPDSYFLVNLKQTGYFRVRYDEANWMLIARELSHGNFSTIPTNSRAMLIDDAAVFFENKILDIRIFLELIKYLQHDTDYIPWMAATNNLVYMRQMVDDGASRLSSDFKRFLRVLLAKTFDAFGAEEVEDEPHYHKHIRNIAINWACQAHLESCINETRDKFNEVMTKKRYGFSSDHERALYCNGILKAEKTEFDYMWNLFKTTTDASRRSFYLRSMGCIENEELLTKFITLTIDSSDDIENSEKLTIIRAVYQNGPIGLNVTLKFFRENCDDVIGLFNQLESSLSSVFRGMANRINSVTLAKQLTDLLTIYNLDEATENEVEEVIEENLLWIETYSSDIQDFLDDFFSGSSPSSIVSYLVIVFGLAFNWIMQN